MGGGGANSLDSPKIGESSDFEDADLSDNDNKEETTWDTPTYKTYEDYFTDYNITAETITDQDLTGVGSASDPYLVHSTRGFLYLTNYNLTNKSLNNKYIELTCDIILNDESIDNNGNISGGDGIVYHWSGIATGNETYFNGNAHTIFGLYYSNEEGICAGLFGPYVQVRLVKNLNFENIFVYAKKWSSAIGGSKIYNTINCNVYSGKIETTNVYAGGIVYDGDLILNCNNFSNVICQGVYAGGLSAMICGRIENSNNYGFVKSKSTSGGLSAGWRTNKNVEIIGCNNYANVYAQDGTVGGIVGIFHYYNNAEITIIDCINYGNLDSPTGSVVAGILGVGEGTINIIRCANYGKLSNGGGAKGCAQIMKASQNMYIKSQVVANIYECYSISKGEPIVETCQQGEGLTDLPVILNIKNYKFDMKSDNNSYACVFLNYIWQKAEINIENVEGNIDLGNTQMYFFNSLSNNNVEIKVSNVVLNGKIDGLKNERYEYNSVITGSSFLEIENFVFNCFVGGINKSCYYGSDFSGFYSNWKTGEIGLKALNGKGFYQATVTEELLQNKGYVKKNFPA